MIRLLFIFSFFMIGSARGMEGGGDYIEDDQEEEMAASMVDDGEGAPPHVAMRLGVPVMHPVPAHVAKGMADRAEQERLRLDPYIKEINDQMGPMNYVQKNKFLIDQFHALMGGLLPHLAVRRNQLVLAAGHDPYLGDLYARYEALERWLRDKSDLSTVETKVKISEIESQIIKAKKAEAAAGAAAAAGAGAGGDY